MKNTKNNIAGMSTEKEFDVVVIGEINVDLILTGNVDPEFGQVEKIVQGAHFNLGSSAVIFACGTARLGLKTAFIGIVGDDIFGHFMNKSMNERGIDTTGVKVKKGIETGFSVILAKENDRAILTYPGSIPELRYEDVDFSIISRSKHLHLASYFLLDELRPDIPMLFENAKKIGVSISLDTNYDPKELWDGGLQNALQHIDLFLPNKNEIIAISKEKNLEQAIAKLNHVVPLVVVKLGEEGSVAQQTGGYRAQKNIIPVDVVDTVGAGDSFDAGFISGYLREMGLEQSLQLATICGSLSTRKSGGTNAQPDFEEALSYMVQ
jgi:sugar/nucleoside kinase (ribokinase family)